MRLSSFFDKNIKSRFKAKNLINDFNKFNFDSYLKNYRKLPYKGIFFSKLVNKKQHFNQNN